LINEFSETNKIKTMKEYMLIIRVPVSYSPDDAKSVTALWDEVTNGWKAEGIFVSSYVFPSAGFVVSDGGSMAGRETVASHGLKIVSAIVLRASDFAEVTERAGQCPILKQNGNVEVAEIMVRSVKPEYSN
jgi:hypothetical protein